MEKICNTCYGRLHPEYCVDCPWPEFDCPKIVDGSCGIASNSELCPKCDTSDELLDGEHFTELS